MKIQDEIIEKVMEENKDIHSIKLVNCEDLPERTRKELNLPPKGFAEIYIGEEDDSVKNVKELLKKALQLQAESFLLEKETSERKLIEKIFEEIELVVELYPHKHGNELNAEIREYLIKKKYLGDVK